MKRFVKSLRNNALLILIIFIVIMTGWIYYSTKAPGLSIKTYEECVAAGNPRMESFPAKCRTQDGRIFVQPVQVKDTK